MSNVSSAGAWPRIACATLVGLLASMAPAVAGGIPHAGDVAPSFSAPRAGGGNVQLSDYRGKPLYLNFFASWCGPCNDEAPSVAILYRKYRTRGLSVLGINELENRDKALAFARQYKWPFAVSVDADGNVGRQYGAIGLPVHVFIDKMGRVSTFRLGEMDASEIEAAIRKIL